MLTSPRYHEHSIKVEEKIRQVFNFENDTAPYIIYDVNYWLFGEVRDKIPERYFSEDASIMTKYQYHKIEKHMQTYNDEFIPFLMPWFGTGVLASGFGIDVKFQDGMDPAVDMAKVTEVSQMREFKSPDPEKHGIMPMVLNAMKYMRSNTDLPIGVTDCQGPLTTALSLIGYENMIYWMYDYPDKIHELMQLVTDSLIKWVKYQKVVAHQDVDDDAYILGIKIPKGYGGVWISDDDSVIFSKDLYKEFVVPYNSQVLNAFGGGGIHYCGCANQHIENYLATEGLTCIHNMNLDNLDEAAKMKHSLVDKNIVYITADFNVKDEYIEEYYEQLFKKMGTKGLIVAPYIAPATDLYRGKYMEANRNPDIVGRRIEKAIKRFNK